MRNERSENWVKLRSQCPKIKDQLKTFYQNKILKEKELFIFDFLNLKTKNESLIHVYIYINRYIDFSSEQKKSKTLNQDMTLTLAST